jgi:hypothetical protein
VAHNKSPKSSASEIDPELLIGNRSQSIYVCTDALLNFSENYLSKIKDQYVLVSGDSDLSVGERLISDPRVQRILHDKNLLVWYAQNLDVDHPKLEQIPIGIDYHTMWDLPGWWGLKKQSAFSQEHSLISILQSSPKFESRALMAYCNFQFALDRGDRKECMHRLDRRSCFFEPTRIPRKSTWQRQSQFMFVVSPEGVGIDCHRTWEALLLGCIPIVKRTKFTKLINNLPALIIDDWSEISVGRLLESATTAASRQYDFNPLLLSFWDSKINGKKFNSLPLMTIAEFRAIFCEDSP